MIPYLVDSNVFSEFFKEKRHPSVMEWLMTHDWYIPVVIVSEILEGIEACASERKRLEFRIIFDGLLDQYGNFVVDWDMETALTWARLSHSQASKRQPQALWDSLIDAMGVRHNAVIVTRNGKDFRHSTTLDPWTGLEYTPGKPAAG